MGFPITKVSDLTRPELQIYANLSENQLLHYFEPHGGLFMAESPMIIERAILAGYEPLSLLLDEKEAGEKRAGLLELCREVPVYSADFNALSRQTGFRFPLTRGALCAMKRHPLPSVEDVCRGARRICILENVVNPTNVGAIFRSAAALGIDAILLTPGSSDPLYRRAIRVSMATVFQIPWTYFDEETQAWQVRAKTEHRQERALHRQEAGDYLQKNEGLPQGHEYCLQKNEGLPQETGSGLQEGQTAFVWPQPAISRLKEMGFKTVAMALKDDSVGLEDPQLLAEEKLAIIMGTEGDGLADHTIDGCDYTVKIPMAHGVDSLNVAAASAVAFWQLRAR